MVIIVKTRNNHGWCRPSCGRQGNGASSLSLMFVLWSLLCEGASHHQGHHLHQGHSVQWQEQSLGHDPHGLQQQPHASASCAMTASHGSSMAHEEQPFPSGTSATTTYQGPTRNPVCHDAATQDNSLPQPPPQQHCQPPPPPPPLDQLPWRFLQAGKGDVRQGWKRYHDTLAWRHEHHVNDILRQPIPEFAALQRHYQQYFHGRSRCGQPVFYERPGKTNLQALRHEAPTLTLERLVWYYTYLTEFLWQVLEPDDYATSLYVLDLEGIAMRDFVGDTRRFVRQAAALSARHYPERAGTILILNAPRWFAVLWRAIQPVLDPSTLHKIQVVSSSSSSSRAAAGNPSAQSTITQTLLQYIAPDQLPANYGGRGPPLGQAPEHQWFQQLVTHNNNNKIYRGADINAAPPLDHHDCSLCPICQWKPVRSY